MCPGFIRLMSLFSKLFLSGAYTGEQSMAAVRKFWSCGGWLKAHLKKKNPLIKYGRARLFYEKSPASEIPLRLFEKPRSENKSRSPLVRKQGTGNTASLLLQHISPRGDSKKSRVANSIKGPGPKSRSGQHCVSRTKSNRPKAKAGKRKD